MPGKEWVANGCGTYLHVDTTTDEANVYINMTTMIVGNQADLSAVFYTQLTDLEEECDGLLNYDRSAKFSAADMANVVAANKGMIAAATERGRKEMGL